MMQEKIHEKMNFSGGVAGFCPREAIFIPALRSEADFFSARGRDGGFRSENPSRADKNSPSGHKAGIKIAARG